jgi:hypothetical protein
MFSRSVTLTGIYDPAFIRRVHIIIQQDHRGAQCAP